MTNVSFSFNSFKLMPLEDKIKDFFNIVYAPSGRMSAGLSTTITITFTPQLNEDINSFFPIGKLQKLTFRLERPDGSLYETNGVDNSFLCALKYRTIPNSSAETKFDGPGRFPAAPGYSGDYIQTLQHRWRQEAAATYQSHNKVTYDRCRPRTG